MAAPAWVGPPVLVVRGVSGPAASDKRRFPACPCRSAGGSPPGCRWPSTLPSSMAASQSNVPPLPCRRWPPARSSHCARGSDRSNSQNWLRVRAGPRRWSAHRGSAGPDRGSARAAQAVLLFMPPRACPPAGPRRRQVRYWPADRRCALRARPALARTADRKVHVLKHLTRWDRGLAQPLRHIGDART